MTANTEYGIKTKQKNNKITWKHNFLGGETLIEFALSVGKFAKFAMYELKGGELVVGKPQGTS